MTTPIHNLKSRPKLIQKHLRIGDGDDALVAFPELQDLKEPARTNERNETTKDLTLIAALFSFLDRSFVEGFMYVNL